MADVKQFVFFNIQYLSMNPHLLCVISKVALKQPRNGIVEKQLDLKGQINEVGRVTQRSTLTWVGRPTHPRYRSASPPVCPVCSYLRPPTCRSRPWTECH